VTKLFFERPTSTNFEIIIEQIAQPDAAPAVEVFRREEKEEFAALQGLFSFLLELAVLGAPSPLRMRRLNCCQARHSKAIGTGSFPTCRDLHHQSPSDRLRPLRRS
jgi:hypothetical protein